LSGGRVTRSRSGRTGRSGCFAFVFYQQRTGSLILIHTEVAQEFGSQGVGSRLAAGTLDDIRARGLLVTPLCPFIAQYIERHPEYGDLIAEQATR
jgi:uncharacterized protein